MHSANERDCDGLRKQYVKEFWTPGGPWTDQLTGLETDKLLI